MGKQSADGQLHVKRMRAGQKVAVIENVTIWAESTWKAYADHGDDTHIVTGKEKYVADTINLNDYYLWQGKATDTNNYYSVYALIWKIETTTDNKKKLYLRTKYFTVSSKGDKGDDALQYIIECDNETPNITNGTVWVAFTAYTQLGQQQRQLANIEAGKLWWDIDGNPLSALAVTNPLSIGISKDFTINLCTPKGIVATKHVTPVKNGQPGQPGAQGLQGCIMRVSEWAPGVEYHNDEALTSGTMYLDIAVVTTGAKTFNAFKCQVTHTSTADNAPVAGNTTTQWQPFNGMAPIYTPLILAENGLIRLAQTNQIIVTDKDSNVTGGMQGDPTLPIIWAGSTTASNGTFRVMADGTMYASKGVFSGTLDGVSGTFESLADKSNKCKIGFQDNGFFFTGYTRFYDSIDVDGDINQQGGGIFYTSNVYCRGVLGSRNRTIAVIDGRQITVYPNGYEQPSNKKTGTLTSATKDGKTVYNIELYSPLTGDGISGMPIDIVIFAPGFSGAELYYQLTGAVGKKVTLLSSKDKAGKIYVAFADGWNLIQKGGIVEAVYIGDLMTPASTKISGIGNGWMHGQMIDNTWA